MRALPSLLTKISVTKSGAMYPEPPPPPYRFLASALPPCAPHPPLPATIEIPGVRPAVHRRPGRRGQSRGQQVLEVGADGLVSAHEGPLERGDGQGARAFGPFSTRGVYQRSFIGVHRRPPSSRLPTPSIIHPSRALTPLVSSPFLRRGKTK